jgi:hypothetical protein
MEIAARIQNRLADLSCATALGHVIRLEDHHDRWGDRDRHPGRHLPRRPVELRREADPLGPLFFSGGNPQHHTLAPDLGSGVRVAGNG